MAETFTNHLPEGYILKGYFRDYTITSVNKNGKKLPYLGAGGFGITYLSFVKTKLKGNLGSIETKLELAIKEIFVHRLCKRNPKTYEVIVDEYSQEFFEKAKKLLIKEAQIASKIEHPNIVKVIEVFEQNNTVYLVMEYIKGTTLKQFILENNISFQDKLALIYQIISAIYSLHQNNILHLDIKPENILINENLESKLIDFGLAKIFERREDVETSNTIVGFSRHYAPVEMYSNSKSREIGVWTDIYSLGALIYFILFGKDLKESVLRIIEEDELIQTLNDNEPIHKILKKCIELKKADRYSSCEVLLKELEKNYPYVSERKITEVTSKEHQTNNQKEKPKTSSSSNSEITTVYIGPEEQEIILGKNILQKEYDECVKKAEKFLNEKKFQEALEWYQKAKEFNINTKQINEKIKEIKNEIQKQEEVKKEFKYLNNIADTLLSKKDYQGAIEVLYKGVKLEEYKKYFEDRINEIKKTIEIEQEKEYEQLKSEGENYLSKKNYQKALEVFQKGLKLEKYRTYFEEKISETKKLIQEEEKERLERELKREFEQLKKEGEEYLNKKNYQKALEVFQKGLKLDKYRTYFEEKISETKNLIQEEEKNKIQETTQVQQIIETKSEKNEVGVFRWYFGLLSIIVVLIMASIVYFKIVDSKTDIQKTKNLIAKQKKVKGKIILSDSIKNINVFIEDTLTKHEMIKKVLFKDSVFLIIKQNGIYATKKLIPEENYRNLKIFEDLEIENLWKYEKDKKFVVETRDKNDNSKIMILSEDKILNERNIDFQINEIKFLDDGSFLIASKIYGENGDFPGLFFVDKKHLKSSNSENEQMSLKNIYTFKSPGSFRGIEVNGNVIYACGYSENNDIRKGLFTIITKENDKFKLSKTNNDFPDSTYFNDIRIVGNNVFMVGGYRSFFVKTDLNGNVLLQKSLKEEKSSRFYYIIPISSDRLLTFGEMANQIWISLIDLDGNIICENTINKPSSIKINKYFMISEKELVLYGSDDTSTKFYKIGIQK